MNKPLGGRGQKAPYDTVQVRCPVPIKPRVDALIAEYRESILTGGEPTKKVESDSTIKGCLKLVFRFIEETGQTDKLHTRNNVNLVRFRDWLISQINQNTV